MPSLTSDQEARVAKNNAESTWHCDACGEKHIQRYCGRCDLVYYTCGCPHEPDGTPYDRDHSKCR
jgi:hypothetical protein